MARGKFFKFFGRRKERIQPLDFDFHLNAVLQAVLELAQSDRRIFLRIQRGTDGCE